MLFICLKQLKHSNKKAIVAFFLMYSYKQLEIFFKEAKEARIKFNYFSLFFYQAVLPSSPLLAMACRGFQTSSQVQDVDSAAKFIGAGAATVGVAGQLIFFLALPCKVIYQFCLVCTCKTITNASARMGEEP